MEKNTFAVTTLSEKKLLLSVIICTYNRASLLMNCLQSLSMQTLPVDNYEIIVIDNNSTDQTFNIVSEFQHRIVNLRYIFETEQGLSAARNRGFKEANGTYLVYLDDDALAPSAYLASIFKIVELETPDFLGGPVYPYYTTPSPWWFQDAFEIRAYEDRSGFSLRCNISGGNFVVRKSLLGQLGLFDKRFGMTGDKLGLSEERKLLEQYRMAIPLEEQRVYYGMECFIQHHTPKEKMRLSYILKRSFYSGWFANRMDASLGVNKIVAKGIGAVFTGVWRLFYRPLREAWINGFKLNILLTAIIMAVNNIFWGVGYTASQVLSMVSVARW